MQKTPEIVLSTPAGKRNFQRTSREMPCLDRAQTSTTSCPDGLPVSTSLLSVWSKSAHTRRFDFFRHNAGRKITNHDMNFHSFSRKNKRKSRFLTFCRGSICKSRIKAPRNLRRANGIRRPAQGHGRLCFVCRLYTASERLPKEAAGRGRTSTLLPRNLEEEEPQQEERAKIL